MTISQYDKSLSQILLKIWLGIIWHKHFWNYWVKSEYLHKGYVQNRIYIAYVLDNLKHLYLFLGYTSNDTPIRQRF